MPPIGLLLGNVDFSSLAVTLKEATDSTPAVTIKYELFINTVIDFVIVAFAIFMVIKQMNHLKKPAPGSCCHDERLSALLDECTSQGEQVRSLHV
jgi:large conductance mechanosensitive channel protein